MSEIQEILFDEATILAKVSELAVRISHDYAGTELVMVPILKGACVFAADLMRRITVPTTVDFISASSYGLATESSRKISVTKDLDTHISGRHVLLVDTIIDTGKTVQYLARMLSERDPASLHIAVLLDKKCRREAEVPLAYRGFEIPDRFVAGYGMDCRELYRNLPQIVIVKPLK
jgi:hypoxanthine phosphoribosyltransferase